MFVIGANGTKSIIGLVDQAGVDAFRQSQGQKLDVRIWGQGDSPIAGEIERVLPRGSTSLAYPALSALAGRPPVSSSHSALTRKPGSTRTRRTPVN